MTGTETPQAGHQQPPRPQFTATVLLEHSVSLSFAQIQAELRHFAPHAVLGDWRGTVSDPAVDPGIQMLSLDGEKLAVLVIDGPAPAAILRSGPYPSPLWPNAESEAAAHKAHIIIIAPENPDSRSAALAKARAVTLIARAIARIVPAVGVDWADGAHLMKAELFNRMTEHMGEPEANATPFWIRIKLTKGTPTSQGVPTLTVGTLGLRGFGIRELEYASVPLDAGFLIPHAYSVVEYLFRSGKILGDGETIGAEGQARFGAEHADQGYFDPFPITRLRLLGAAQ